LGKNSKNPQGGNFLTHNVLSASRGGHNSSQNNYMVHGEILCKIRQFTTLHTWTNVPLPTRFYWNIEIAKTFDCFKNCLTNSEDDVRNSVISSNDITA